MPRDRRGKRDYATVLSEVRRALPPRSEFTRLWIDGKLVGQVRDVAVEIQPDLQFARLKAISKQVTYKPSFTFFVEREFFNSDMAIIGVVAAIVDVVTKDPGFASGHGRPFPLSHLTRLSDEQIVKHYFYAAVQQFEEHETKEWFQFRGQHVFDPHPELRPQGIINALARTRKAAPEADSAK